MIGDNDPLPFGEGGSGEKNRREKFRYSHKKRIPRKGRKIHSPWFVRWINRDIEVLGVKREFFRFASQLFPIASKNNKREREIREDGKKARLRGRGKFRSEEQDK